MRVARSIRRGLSAAAVVLLVVAQLGALAHQAAVRHVRCEHGELVEAASIEAHLGGDARLVGVTNPGAPDDEHCTLASALRQHGTAPHTPTLVVAMAACTSVAPPATAARFAAASLYLIAPKTSPPPDRSVLFT
jgi:hypothetical protein